MYVSFGQQSCVTSARFNVVFMFFAKKVSRDYKFPIKVEKEH